MTDSGKSYAQVLVEERTGRELQSLLRELYVEKRHSQEEIARALRVARTTVSQWLREYGITREDRPPVDLIA